MKLRDRTVVVTGGAAGIGKALCERFHREGAKAVIVADIDGDGAREVARSVGSEGFACDVASAADVARLIDAAERRGGPIDLYCSNAGIFGARDPAGHVAGAPDEAWQRAWSVNVMGHVHAARVLVPRMKARGGGAFLLTVSAAGLLSQIGNAVYSTTKHAAIGFAESLAIAHRDDNIRVFVLCPQGVDTRLLRDGGPGPQHGDGVLSPDQVADGVVAGLEREGFLILPHPQVADYMRRKATDYDRWIGGMAKLRRAFVAD
ncbi:MAG TPA: SDR family oxidoreductase [Stellaceae bacterium]|nr:SDR family oxidoreductase [Stellaceae bacterium]